MDGASDVLYLLSRILIETLSRPDPALREMQHETILRFGAI
jgi:hypothetical protein